MNRDKKVDRHNYQLKYYGTYYFCNLIQNVVEGENFGYLRAFDEFFSGLGYQNKFQKDSVLHGFIEFCIDRVFQEDLDKVLYEKGEENYKLPDFKDSDFLVCRVLEFYGIERESLIDWISHGRYHVSEFVDDIISQYFRDFIILEVGDLIERLTEEVFHVLFLNRTFLLEFNLLVAGCFTELIEEDDEDFKDMFQKPHYFKRARIPIWVKRAVFFRDNGYCVFCPANLSGIIDALPNENYDHMVPLANGGINDVSNIQLSCESCNKSKNAQSGTTDIYRRMYKK
jgi:hypothetical protein